MTYVQKDHKRKVIWSKDDIDYIRKNYKTASDSEMAEHLGKTTSAVKKKRIEVSQYVLDGPPSKRWSEVELKFLRNNASEYQISALAMRLQRSETAVKRKLLELFGTSCHLNLAGLNSSQEVANLLGVSNKSINLFIQSYGLPAVKIKLNPNNKKNKFIFGILLDDLYDWLEDNELEGNRHFFRLDFTKVDISIVDYHSQWFLQHYKKQTVFNPRKRTFWTHEEESILYQLFFRLKKTPREISYIMKKDVEVIRGKIKKMKIKCELDEGYLNKLKNSKITYDFKEVLNK